MNEIKGATAAALYGPRWEDVVDVIWKAQTLTPKQLGRCVASGAAWTPTVDAMWTAALEATRIAAFATGRGNAWEAALGSARAAAGTVVWGSGRPAAWIAEDVAAGAAAAAVVADLVEKHGLTAKHITDLTRAWRVIIGAA